ncbi:transporter substrate-binding domain-containing protein [Bdellovibrio sp. 22V]|uniref:substrate-binding periplasmic protein n=1 Tax=Bdellovibrio sp. 22V TaxID=3044166 RepID=UPI002543D97F|nr:transporter substrate-binding domain-containing protein [Bdellovibrio sp. 22V]WII71457.1 transporter substrate-binding domain-containing protein [Bdellovibrio sp. 22V]
MLRLFLSLLFFWNFSSAVAKTIVINGEDDWAPYSSATKDYKNVQGLAPDIVRAAFKTQGITVITRPVPFARCLYEVSEGSAIGCFDTVMSIETQDGFIFHTTPLFKADMVVYGRVHEPQRTLSFKDLEGKVVGTTNGYTYPTEFIANTKIIHSPGPTEKSQLEKLASGRVQYAILWGLTAPYLFEERPDLAAKIKSLGVISTTNLYLSFSKKHKDGAKYAAVLEKGLQAIIADGTYAKIVNEFNSRYAIPTKP